ncbi:MAG: glycosyltransferase [Chlamydiales bacterium]|nr:glycosyltransferase [Chlamydiales bacterium]
MRFVIILFLICTCVADAKTVCLNMIVKDESAIIERCLNSCKDKIDYWVIVDMGSCDATKQIICQCMKNKPGELHERSWVNFEYNRNEALDLARDKADYILFIDADQRLEFEPTFNEATLEDPYYYVTTEEPGGLTSKHILLVDASYPWHWTGSVHESISCEGMVLDFQRSMNGVKLINVQDGCHASDPNRHLKDAETLEIEVRKNPTDSHAVFCLAQCYLNANQKILALKYYERRVQMEGSLDEKWYSLYTVARLHDEMGFPSDVITKEYCQAFQQRPIRAEPLGLLALHHLQRGNFILAYALAVQALGIKKPQDGYFVEDWFYEYGSLCIYADSARCLGAKEQALKAYQHVLKRECLPEGVRSKIKKTVEELSAPISIK